MINASSSLLWFKIELLQWKVLMGKLVICAICCNIYQCNISRFLYFGQFEFSRQKYYDFRAKIASWYNLSKGVLPKNLRRGRTLWSTSELALCSVSLLKNIKFHFSGNFATFLDCSTGDLLLRKFCYFFGL